MLVSKTKNNIILKLSSGWQLTVNENCIATLGNVSNSNFKYSSIGSAGKARALGRKPKVRGVAKNPCDHPHGGGMEKNLLWLLLYLLEVV